MDGLFNNDSHMNNNFQFDFPHMNYQNSLFMEQQQQQHQYQHHEISPDGSSSPSSFMCLSKPSYENNNSSDFEGSGSDRLNDNDGEDGNHRLPKIIKRAIYKNYEPITDNGVTYNYQDDPSEYKKARKRVQNRVSATRIRGKNKNFVEELKVEVDDLRDEITALKTQNNVLTSENALLKQQITFMERLLMGGAGKAAAAPEVTLEQETKLDVHPVNQHKNNSATVNNKQEVASYSRAAPSSGRLKKHTAYLGLMTILLCISSILTQGAQARGIMHAISYDSKVNFFRPFTTSSNAPAVSSELNINHKEPTDNALVKIDPTSWTSWTSIAIIGIETLFIGIYVLYAIYVFTLAHQKYVNSKEKQEKQ